MISRIIRILISILGVILGTTSYFSLERYFPQLSFGMENIYLVGIVSGLILGVIFYLISPWIFSKVRAFVKVLDKEISKYPQTDILPRFSRTNSRSCNSIFNSWYICTQFQGCP